MRSSTNSIHRSALLFLLATLVVLLAPTAFAQSAYNWGTWTAGPLTSQPQFIWNGGSSFTARTPSILSASWTNGVHSATMTTTQPPGFAMIVDPTSAWGGSDDGPPPPNGIYTDNTALGGLVPNTVIQSFSIVGGISSDMVVGFYDVLPSFIKLAAYDRFGAPVSFLGVSSAFQNETDYVGNNTLTLNADGTFSGSITPRPGGSIDSAFAGFAGFDPSIVRIDVISTRPAQNGGIGSWGDGYSFYLGSIPPVAPVPTLTGVNQLILAFVVIGLAGWARKRLTNNS